LEINMKSATWRFGMALVLLLAGTSVVLADSKPDLSDPKGAAKAFATGVQKADLPLIKSASIGSDADYRLMDAMSQAVNASMKLRDAVSAKFGPEQAKQLSQAGPEDLAGVVDKSTVKVDGDNASLSEPGQDPANALKLKKIDGQWKVDLNQIPNKDQLAQSAPIMKELQKVVEQTTGEVKDGKYKNVQEVQIAVQTKMRAVIASMLSRPPARQPAGQGK